MREGETTELELELAPGSQWVFLFEVGRDGKPLGQCVRVVVVRGDGKSVLDVVRRYPRHGPTPAGTVGAFAAAFESGDYVIEVTTEDGRKGRAEFTVDGTLREPSRRTLALR